MTTPRRDTTGDPAPDPGNTDPQQLTRPLDCDDDVYTRLGLVNPEPGTCLNDLHEHTGERPTH